MFEFHSHLHAVATEIKSNSGLKRLFDMFLKNSIAQHEVSTDLRKKL